MESFIDHFKLLWGAGQEASLNIESKLGEITFSLSCKVGRIVPPTPMSPASSRQKYRSPSYFRRQTRRRAERDAQNVSEEASRPDAEQAVGIEATL